MKNELRFCLTSLVHDHAWWSADQVTQTPGARLVAVADKHVDLLEKMRKKLGDTANYFTDVDEMLERTKPDALIITAPNNEHRNLIEQAAYRHIHCLVQKPLATTFTDARAIRNCVEAAGIKVMVNYFPLWDPTTAELFRRIRAGEVGEVQHLTVVNGTQGPKGMGVLSEYYQGWLYDPVCHGGGVLADQGTYGLDYIVWVLGRPLGVFATQVDVNQHPEGWADDMCTLVLTYPKALAVVMASWAWPHPRSEILCYGPKGSICMRESLLIRKEPSVRFDVPVEPRQIEPAPVKPERKYGIAWFVHSLQNNLEIEAPHSVDLNVIVCEIVDAAKQSISQRGIVMLE
jgi:predicted dehydrogenase